MHVPKDKSSKLDDKSRQYIFVFYGQDEFEYRYFDPVEKKLVRRHDVVFLEDQTIEDLDKDEKVDFESSENLVNVDPILLTIPPSENLQNDEIKLILKMVIIFRITSMSLMLQCKTMWFI